MLDGTVWLRFGALGPLFLGIGLALVLAVGLLLLVPYAREIVASSQPWWGAVLAAVVSGASVLAISRTLRRATVR